MREIEKNEVTIDGSNLSSEDLAKVDEAMRMQPGEVSVISYDIDELLNNVNQLGQALTGAKGGSDVCLQDALEMQQKIQDMLAYKVERPVVMRNTVFLDLETSGVNPAKDRVVELGIIHVDNEGVEHRYEQFINPGFLLPQENIDIHNITNEMLKDAPSFEEQAEDIYNILKQSKHFVAYNCTFDFQFLANELERANPAFKLNSADYTFLDPCAIYKKLYPHTLESAHRLYVGTPIENAHRALNDIVATKDVLVKQFKRHKDYFKGKTLKQVQLETVGSLRIMGSWFDETEQGVVFRKGKHKDEVVHTGHLSYLSWISRLDDTTASEKDFIQEICNQQS